MNGFFFGDNNSKHWQMHVLVLSSDEACLPARLPARLFLLAALAFMWMNGNGLSPLSLGFRIFSLLSLFLFLYLLIFFLDLILQLGLFVFKPGPVIFLVLCYDGDFDEFYILCVIVIGPRWFFSWLHYLVFKKALSWRVVSS